MSSTGQVLWLALVLAAAAGCQAGRFGSSAAPARALTSFAGCPAAVGNTKLPANLAPSCLSYQCNTDGTVTVTVSKSCGWSNILILGANDQCVQRLENGGGSTTFKASCGTTYTIWIKDGSYNGKGANNYQGGALPDTFCSVPPALANLEQWCRYADWTPACSAAPNTPTNCPTASDCRPCEYLEPATSPCLCATIKFRPATCVCREAVPGGCDVAEYCTGSSPTCPDDVVVAAGTTCRQAVSGGCDVPEKCDGVAATCPVDAFQPAGTPCGSWGTCAGGCATCNNNMMMMG